MVAPQGQASAEARAPRHVRRAAARPHGQEPKQGRRHFDAAPSIDESEEPMGPLAYLQFGGSFFSVQDALRIAAVSRRSCEYITGLALPQRTSWLDVLDDLEDHLDALCQLVEEGRM